MNRDSVLTRFLLFFEGYGVIYKGGGSTVLSDVFFEVPNVGHEFAFDFGIFGEEVVTFAYIGF
jgi:hypothetical protein